MSVLRLTPVIALLIPAAFSASCADGAGSPSEVAISSAAASAASGAAAGMDHSMHGGSTLLSATTLDPFTFRAALDPFKIHQLPEFLMHSRSTSDVVMQRLIFNPGAGPWHTHPGPSFVYVIQGSIRLDRFNKHEGCIQTPVHSAGSAYSEAAHEVHRAVVTSDQPAVLLVTRFNIPPGAPITNPAADPGC